MENQSITYSEGLVRFIDRSPVNYYAIRNAQDMLLSQGFTELSERERWNAEYGGRYFIQRNDSALIAFVIPEHFRGMNITASHCDSPCLRIKENPEIDREGRYTVLNIEKYGGMLMAPWFDRPLSVAGRIFAEKDGRLVRNLVDFGCDMLIIPSLAIHMDRQANEGRKINPQEEMLPLYALKSGDCESSDSSRSKGGIIRQAAELAGCAESDVLGADLFVYNRQKGTIWGNNGEFLSAPRLDDLQCVYTSLKGFLEAESHARLSVLAVFDNEEVGSSTRQGAASTFLSDSLQRLYRALGRDEEVYHIDLEEGLMLSMDNAHAVHPNYLGKADPVNRPVIGGGVVLKFAGNQKYCTDGYSAALFRQVCRKAGCREQCFTNRADMPGGSTLGNISGNQVPIATADIGIAQLAMHSPFETSGTADTEDMVKIVRTFYEER